MGGAGPLPRAVGQVRRGRQGNAQAVLCPHGAGCARLLAVPPSQRTRGSCRERPRGVCAEPTGICTDPHRSMLVHRSGYTHWCPQPRSPQVQAGRTGIMSMQYTQICAHAAGKRQTYSLHIPLILRYTHPRSSQASTLPGHVCI